jgi:curved DNA-binding protein CbpA
MKTHYDTLGVSKTASIETIKAEFRKLSKQTHPDVGGASACAERFKEISAAANVLTNEKRRRTYDYHLRQASPMGSGMHRSEHGFKSHVHNRPGPGVATTPSQIFVSNIMRPRSFVAGAVAALFGAYAMSSFGGETSKLRHEGATLVKAWKNPKTGLYEQPAPWDEEYRRLNPTLEDIPRHLVEKRTI